MHPLFISNGLLGVRPGLLPSRGRDGLRCLQPGDALLQKLCEFLGLHSLQQRQPVGGVFVSAVRLFYGGMRLLRDFLGLCELHPGLFPQHDDPAVREVLSDRRVSALSGRHGLLDL